MCDRIAPSEEIKSIIRLINKVIPFPEDGDIYIDKYQITVWHDFYHQTGDYRIEEQIDDYDIRLNGGWCKFCIYYSFNYIPLDFVEFEITIDTFDKESNWLEEFISTVESYLDINPSE